MRPDFLRPRTHRDATAVGGRHGPAGGARLLGRLLPGPGRAGAVAVRPGDRHAEALRSLHSVWIDAGKRDDFSLDLGAQASHRALLGHDVPADRIRFELFEAGHGGIDYRYPLSLAWPARGMSR